MQLEQLQMQPSQRLQRVATEKVLKKGRTVKKGQSSIESELYVPLQMQMMRRWLKCRSKPLSMQVSELHLEVMGDGGE